MQIGLALGMVVLPGQHLSGQTDAGPQVEISPQGTIGEPIVQTNPDDGTPIAGSAEGTIGNFSVPRQLRLSISLLGGYDDNVRNRSASGTGPGGGTGAGAPGGGVFVGGGGSSFFTSANAVLSYSFGTPRTSISLSSGTGITYYFENPRYDPNLYLRFSLKHKLTPRLTLSIASFTSYQAQPDLSTDLSANRRLGNFFRSNDSLSAAYQLTPRFSTVTSYRFSALEYDSSTGSFQNRLQHRLGEELRFLLLPTTTISGEYRFGIVDFDVGSRDATSQTLLAGVDQTFSPQLNASLRAGVESRSSDDNKNRTSPHLESTLHYDFGPSNSISWTNRYSIEESDVPGASGRTTFRTGLNVKYALTARILASLVLNYSRGDNQRGGNQRGGNSSQGGGSMENSFDIAPSARYAITPNLGVNVGYHYTQLDSDSALRSYSRNRYFAGLNLTF